MAGCCLPEMPDGGQSHPDAAPSATPSTAAGSLLSFATARIKGGRIQVGTSRPLLEQDGEGPVRFVRVGDFDLSVSAVTNAEFRQFVESTGYVTEAERLGWSYVFYQFVEKDMPTTGVVGAEWWRRVEGAAWSAPFGPGSSIDDILDHPVVHIAWEDAVQFCAWAGGRLPTEAEWEHAARGGRPDPIYPWGDAAPSDAFTPCNIWQGRFPQENTVIDGYAGLAAAVSFEPNGYGLYNMAGNCWEWTADTFRVRSLKRSAASLNAAARQEERKVLKGGSYLCHASYCHRYRIAARMGSTGDSTTGHIGFRVAFDPAI